MLNSERQDLFISDCHFGKVTHFRKNAIPIPNAVAQGDLVKLKSILEKHQPKRVFFMGDLFHSHINSEWDLLQQVLSNFDSEYILIQGNHDILETENYSGLFTVLDEFIYEEKICLSHEPVKHELPVLCGHVHPGIGVQTGTTTKTKLPCFWIENHQLIMPAFGSFTGCIEPNKSRTAQAWAVLNNSIFKV